MSKDIKELVSLLSISPFDSELNFKIAQEYESLGQNASAISFYLRAAEYGSDKNLVYCSLLKVGICLQHQGERDWNVSNSFLQAIQHCPDRPEAYYLLSKFYERTGSWQECHTITEIGIYFSERGLDYVSAIVGYKGKSYLEFQKAISAWWIDRRKESESLFLKLALDDTLDATHRAVVDNNINNLGLIQDKIAIVLPVRDAGTGRSQRLINCLNSWRKQSENLSDVHIIIDEDDVQYFGYLLEEEKENVYVHIKPADLTLMEKINTIGVSIANTYKYMIFIGDDIVFETPWESKFINYLSSVPAGLVFADTLDTPDHVDWATHPCITTNMVRAVGFYGCPAVHHNYFDNFWSEVAKEIGHFHKMPDVIMDHRRIGWTPDHIFAKIVELQSTDKVRYEEYKKTKYAQDLQKIKDCLNAK
jgi:tetratricopeptide (TPR) repeat protein